LNHIDFQLFKAGGGVEVTTSTPGDPIAAPGWIYAPETLQDFYSNYRNKLTPDLRIWVDRLVVERQAELVKEYSQK
jgi:hypothetical protein